MFFFVTFCFLVARSSISTCCPFCSVAASTTQSPCSLVLEFSFIVPSPVSVDVSRALFFAQRVTLCTLAIMRSIFSWSLCLASSSKSCAKDLAPVGTKRISVLTTFQGEAFIHSPYLNSLSSYGPSSQSFSPCPSKPHP
ncbi:hypothetical protein RND81_11G167000 [Saponaria officinalis]|uniref:Secreted protein n=1 Tax=Saponaria officinalis TaxID=3572 RepID=A0AAW1HMY8_SAPOF